jgi:transposase-like protein
VLEEHAMKRRFRCPVSTKRELVAEVLMGYRTEFLARKYGMSPETLRRWVREYRDEVGDLMVKKQKQNEQLVKDAEELKELQKKYNSAMKLLGEKELENAILQDLLKKMNPKAWEEFQNWKAQSK